MKSKSDDLKSLTRRAFAGGVGGLTGAGMFCSQAAQNANAHPQSSSNLQKRAEKQGAPFDAELRFRRQEVAPKVKAFEMTDVRLLPGVFKDAQEANRAYLHRIDADRLLHNFRINAGLASSAQPLGGWEKPDCELRGHFVGHYLSACALMYSATGDQELRKRGEYLVSELAKCQRKLGGGYLSAFPTEYFDRLKARQKVWAPFYTVHKIMAGMYEMHRHCQSAEAESVLEGVADWTDQWTGQIPEAHMQEILDTEFGGMNEALYNLAAATGNDHYAVVGDRFTKKKFFNPLAVRRDELQGLHVNTHIPQVVGGAQRYRLTGDGRFQDVSDFFWYEVTSARAYVTGGTSNRELWLMPPRQLGAELKMSADTTECCCAYNMLKLTRELYQWTGDPRYFDYYERTMLNHRLGAIDLKSGATQYYLSIVPGAWRTFSAEDDSFWCCTGTGVEEFSKLNDSIYFQDGNSLYVNLFIPSELTWKEKGVRIRQESAYPKPSTVTFEFAAAAPVQLPVHIRIPYWAGTDARVKLNGRNLETVPTPASYFQIQRTWHNGDRIEVDIPMHLHVEEMADETTTTAFLYGPLVLAGMLKSETPAAALVVGKGGPDVGHHPIKIEPLRASLEAPDLLLKQQTGDTLEFETTGQVANISFVPLHSVKEGRYSVYWTVDRS